MFALKYNGGINSKSDTAEEKIANIEDILIKNYPKQNKERNKSFKKLKSISVLQANFKQPDIVCVTRVLEVSCIIEALNMFQF